MLEVGWSEILVIAIVLIIVVGPKDLPGMLRTFGRMAGRLRSMANEFKGQFDQALREAELDDVRQGLSEVNKYNPSSALRDAINPIRKFGEDLKSDLKKASDVNESHSQSGNPTVGPVAVADVPLSTTEPVLPVEPPLVPPVTSEAEAASVSAPVEPAKPKRAVKKPVVATDVTSEDVPPTPKIPARPRKTTVSEVASTEPAPTKPKKPSTRKKPEQAGDA